MKSINFLFFFIFVFLTISLLASCVQQSENEKTICTPPYINLGDSCCIDRNSNFVCDNDETQQKDVNLPKEITLDDIEEIFEEHQPNFKGAFVKLGYSRPCSYSGFFTGSRGACYMWQYPSEGVSRDFNRTLFLATLFDFDSNMPSINIEGLSYSQGGWDLQTKTISNGTVKIYEEKAGHDYQKHYHFICGTNYWIQITYSQKTPVEDSNILKIITEILNQC